MESGNLCNFHCSHHSCLCIPLIEDINIGQAYVYLMLIRLMLCCGLQATYSLFILEKMLIALSPFLFLFTAEMSVPFGYASIFNNIFGPDLPFYLQFPTLPISARLQSLFPETNTWRLSRVLVRPDLQAVEPQVAKFPFVW